MSALESVIDIRLTVIRGSMSTALAGPAARPMTHARILRQRSGNPFRANTRLRKKAPQKARDQR